MAKGYSKGRGGFVGTLVSQKFINADPASITRGGATIQAASTSCAVTSTFTSSGTLSLACATTAIEYIIVAGGGGSCCSSSQQHPGAGGGGGGGFLTKACFPVTGGTDLTITIGAGGAASQGDSCTGRGGNSSIAGPGICDVVATGGGYGHRLAHGGPGGSAGGGYNGGTNGNVGNTPPAPSAKGGPQGNNSVGRGGGGACTGTNGIGQACKCSPESPAAPEGAGPNAPLYSETGDGGKGKASPLTGTVLFGGGGGGGGYQNTPCGSPGRSGAGGAFNSCYGQPACGPGGGRGGAYHGTIGAQAGAANKGGGAGGAGGSGFLTGQGFSGAAGGSGFVKILQPAICISASASGIFDLTDQLEARAGDTWPNE
jgi:hypothetical protein